MMRDVNTLSRHACLDKGNQCKKSYNLKTHKEKNKNITYKHYMDKETKNKDIHTYCI